MCEHGHLCLFCSEYTLETKRKLEKMEKTRNKLIQRLLEVEKKTEESLFMLKSISIKEMFVCGIKTILCTDKDVVFAIKDNRSDVVIPGPVVGSDFTPLCIDLAGVVGACAVSGNTALYEEKVIALIDQSYGDFKEAKGFVVKYVQPGIDDGQNVQNVGADIPEGSQPVSTAIHD